ncbi:excinuclease ABC subunit UvrC [Deinococcus peraridilitoris]|uniref:UvrABC system protein C n=1 Tax=Deinococcus peraridilitoris (strain DSM 19664 / LMG 22246 / CIP 109416 / KR-200) TaxID=937777 RepID=L0A7Y4_DEIPD|nr:excinuclease ABC subunit UvrC [Deinococcus peraridilitoris]AFZ69150.1 excinuclease ABC, C subunit [Deinococcus peraridilitoris DSM 19664]
MQFDDLPVLPTHSGVYIFRGASGAAIYIGKANNLRSRVFSHFKAGGKSGRFTREAAALEFITVRNEVEALVLEANLIKQHRPHYNVLLKDDKHYPFLKLTSETYPMLVVTRRVVNDGGSYYGPYPDAAAVRRVKNLIDTMFPLRKNSGLPMQRKPRPCLNYHMGRCLAPCIGAADLPEYGAVVEDVKALLEGRAAPVIARLRDTMKDAAVKQDFEQAARVRDRLQAVEKLFGNEQVAMQVSAEDLDFLGFAAAGEYAMVQLFRMRGGRVVGRDKRFLSGAAESEPSEIIGAFVQDYYTQATHVPPLILIPAEFEDAALWSAFLSERAERRIELRMPQRGDKVDLVDMAQRNAQMGLESELMSLEKRGDHPGLEALREVLALPERPWRIEGYDNSNLFGTNIVSGMVVFEGGRARRGEHRRFKVQGLDHPDDYQAMRQTITRRFTGSLADKLPLPDLVLIDGGRGQLNAALDAMKDAGVQIPVIGLAKREERIVLPSVYGAQWWLTGGSEVGRERELLLPHTHPALRTLIGVRDEVHNYAVSYHRKLRGDSMLRSVFDELPGIGKKRQDALLEHFTSLEDLGAASVEQIARVPGMNLVAARAVKSFLESRQAADSTR